MTFWVSPYRRYPAGIAILIPAEENTHGLHVLTDEDVRFIATGGVN